MAKMSLSGNDFNTSPPNASDMQPLSCDSFLVGFANSMFQASGDSCGETNWSTAADNGSVKPVSLGQINSHWYNFEDDLEKMKSLGVNSYRFSIEWGHIEPEEGVYDEAVLKRYDEIISACLKNNIKPMLTLHHFNEPFWFTHKGGFEKEDNIKCFINFSKKIFERFSQSVKHWCTINEPGVLAFSSYFYGQFPPHRHSIKKTLNYLLNLLKTHVALYKELKQLNNGNDCEIGIVHNVLKFTPRYKWDVLSRVLAPFLTKVVNDLVIQFLQTGHYNYHLRWIYKVNYFDIDATNSYDFFGLNFYGTVVLGFNSKTFYGSTNFPDQTMGQFHLPIDPKGFSAAISEVAALGKPIYITETGHATSEETNRIKFLNEFVNVIEQKIAEKIDIRGLYIWTFTDNYEWDRGHEICFGLYDQYRVERESAKVFKSLANKLLKKMTR